MSVIKLPREISIANFVHRKGDLETVPIFRVCLPLPEAGCRPRWDVTRLPRRSCGRSTNRLRARRGFSTGLSRVAAAHTRYSRSHPSIALLSLLSKNYNALARDPLSIPLLNLRPYYRMPRETGARYPKGADIKIQPASEPSKRQRPTNHRRFGEVGRGWHRLTVITRFGLSV